MIFIDCKTILDVVTIFSTDSRCIKHLEHIRWKGNVISPFDASSTVYKSKNNRYKCRNTNKYFNVRTGTIFEDSKIPLTKWFMAIYLALSDKKGISSYQLSRYISVTQKTAWFMLHRIRMACTDGSVDVMSGMVEVDESYIGGRLKNKHYRERKRIREAGIDNKTPVVGILERGKNVRATAVKTVDTETVLPILYSTISSEVSLTSDGAKIYEGLHKLIFQHVVVNHAAGEYVRGYFHTNNIENFWSHLKRGITGRYHSVSPKHLQRYLDEFTFRHNTRKLNNGERFSKYLSQSMVRLKYKDLVGLKTE
ncbi:MAG TPA: IS1595 family transposase [Bacteroidia bacterium]|nr:IS1595 family transposase [Bacteroidia bacterium]